MFVPSKYLPNPHDAFREPDRRWRRCRYLVEQGRRPSSARDDDATRDGWRYLQDWWACRDHSDRQRLAQRHPAVGAAHHLCCRPDPLPRAELEARLLAGQADEDIAAHCGLSAAAVGVYHDLFFHVRDALDAEAYIVNVVMGPKAHSGLSEDDVDILLKLLGYAHGPLMVDAALRYFRDPPALPVRLDGRNGSALAELRLQLQVRLLILTMVAPAHALARGKPPGLSAALQPACDGDEEPVLAAATAAAPPGFAESADQPVTAFLRERMYVLASLDPPALLPLERSALRGGPARAEASLPARCG